MQLIFPTCEKGLKKCLEPGVVMHIFNLSTQKTEAGASLSLRPVWSTVPGQPGLDSEGSHHNQKAGGDAIEHGSHVSAPASSRTWHPQPGGTGFRVKDIEEKLWTLPP